MIALQQLAKSDSANKIEITQKRILRQCPNLEFVRATTDMDDHGTVHRQKGVSAVEHLRFTNTCDSVSNLVLCVTSNLIKLLAVLGGFISAFCFCCQLFGCKTSIVT